MVKFKFIFRDFYDDESIAEDFKEVENPIGINNLPTGEYMIRGNQKSHRKEYFHTNGKWYLVSDVKKDNGHFYCDSTVYSLFPSLPEKEWNKIRLCRRYITPYWKRHLFGHDFWLELRQLTRDTV